MREREQISRKCCDGTRGKGMAKPSVRQFHDDMGTRSTGWAEMESVLKGCGALGLKRQRPKPGLLAGPLVMLQ
jgi:hypothetical protein